MVQEDINVAAEKKEDLAEEDTHYDEQWQRQQELNDHLALLRILDDPPYDEFHPFASEPLLASSKQRRYMLFNFLAFCLARSREDPVALATTIYAHPSPNQNERQTRTQMNIYIAGAYDSARAMALFSMLKQVWRFSSRAEDAMLHVIQMTEHRLKRRLQKLQSTVKELFDFSHAVDMWGKQESSPAIRPWGKEDDAPSHALKSCFEQLRSFAALHDFDAPHLAENVTARMQTYRLWFFPAGALTTTQFLAEVDLQLTTLPPHTVRLLKLLRRRCFKIRWYDFGVGLLCTFARDAVYRILGPEAYEELLSNAESETDTSPVHIEWLEMPEVQGPMRRCHASAQDAVQTVLANISSDPEDDEPFACNIMDKPFAEIYWTTTCTPQCHPEIQVIEHLRCRGMCPSPQYIGCSQLACRACKWYADRLKELRVVLHTGGLDTMDLHVPAEWMIPPTKEGAECAELIQEEAARIVLCEEHLQRMAWEKQCETEDHPEMPDIAIQGGEGTRDKSIP
ncbi:hypothetical protein BU17DRAFT_98348 [Hysterangium stoloniferum]|nr:hypothetical protein BU17DRAFT_98348 [Hysterangium stoloniferum]